MRIVVFALLCATAWADPAALLTAIEAARGPAAATTLAKSFDELVARHPDSPQLAQACVRLLFVPSSVAVPRLRAVLAARVSRPAAGLARFALGRQLLDGLASTPPSGREAVIDEARRLMAEVASTYADVRLGDKPIKVHADRALYEIEHLMPGKPAPEIVGEDLDGKPLRLTEHRGRVVLLSFWGAWCGPCVAALPEEKRLLERFTGRPFAILGVNIDRNRDAARRIVAAKSVTWRSFYDGSQTGPITTSYNVTGFPMLYLIDRKGVIRHRDVPPDAGVLAGHIESLLAGD